MNKPMADPRFSMGDAESRRSHISDILEKKPQLDPP